MLSSLIDRILNLETVDRFLVFLTNREINSFQFYKVAEEFRKLGEQESYKNLGATGGIIISGALFENVLSYSDEDLAKMGLQRIVSIPEEIQMENFVEIQES